MLTQLLDVFGFLSVVLRGGALAFESLVVGGAVFSVWILRPLAQRWGSEAAPAIQSAGRLLYWSGLGAAFVEIGYVAADSAVLAGTTGLRLGELARANFFIAGVTAALAGLGTAWLCARRRWRPTPVLLAPALLIVGALVATSHAAGRMQWRTLLLMTGALHVSAVGAWIGGLPFLLAALARSRNLEIARRICRRFSKMALFSVAVLAMAGTILSLYYVDSREAVYGTAYGVMLASKVVLFGLLMLLGAFNYFLVRRMGTAAPKGVALLRRFAEAEVGIGFTIVLAAASLSSQPPAADLMTGRLQLSEIGRRFRPQWPSFSTPPVSALSPATPLSFDASENPPAGLRSFVPGASYNPNTPADIAWSEYNHHWAGVIVLVVGFLALAARLDAFRWARHWPLAFIGLAVFLLFRADPENWPLGPRSFWQSFAVAEVLQHRIFVVLIIAFAVFEWRISTNRAAPSRAALVFPAVCAAGGALMLTHSHPLGNIKEELLAELSHVPIAILAVIAGWSRWLEIRLPDRRRRIPSWIWPACFVLIGAILLNYRESS